MGVHLVKSGDTVWSIAKNMEFRRKVSLKQMDF